MTKTFSSFHRQFQGWLSQNRMRYVDNRLFQTVYRAHGWSVARVHAPGITDA
jgi:hypothetical protein